MPASSAIVRPNTRNTAPRNKEAVLLTSPTRQPGPGVRSRFPTASQP
jgi:hypothetical protein